MCAFYLKNLCILQFLLIYSELLIEMLPKVSFVLFYLSLFSYLLCKCSNNLTHYSLQIQHLCVDEGLYYGLFVSHAICHEVTLSFPSH